jgi:hypothetical protein
MAVDDHRQRVGDRADVRRAVAANGLDAEVVVLRALVIQPGDSADGPAQNAFCLAASA